MMRATPISLPMPQFLADIALGPGPNERPPLVLVIGLVAVFLIVALTALVVGLFLVRPWLRCFLAGTPVSLIYILGMRLRGSPVTLIVDTLIAMKFRNLPGDIRQIESTYLANPGPMLTTEQLIERVQAGGK